MSEDPDLATVVSLLDDECTRCILTATSTEPMSATELADRCDVSLPTVTRRVDRLLEAGLVEEATRLRPDGHHDDVYTATLDRAEVRLADGAFEFTLERDERDAADELKRLWERF